MAKALKARQNDILEANTLDLEISREMAVPDVVLDWLKLTPERLQAAVQLLVSLAEQPDPIQQALQVPFQVEQCQVYAQCTPLGVISLVYEAFPELGAIAAGFCLRTANSLILRGGSEASHSNRTIVETLQSALHEVSFPVGTVELLPSDQGDVLREFLTQDQVIKLVIPYGRPSLVQQVARQTTIPLIKPSIGNCHLYWSASGRLDTVRWMILESHRSEPDAVNAIEKVLIHRKHFTSSLALLITTLLEKGFTLKGEAEAVEQFSEITLMVPEEWRQCYLNKTIAFKVVDSLEEAIAWMNQYSNGHANSLATESYSESYEFSQKVDSATIYINTSPRFYRNPKPGAPLALGMCGQSPLFRGFIGLNALTTTKHVIHGNH
jgi:glutamate-5-semialdehyde dehydrogenase